jgi:2-polyprenyl-3-methyl-5-hydroxy-6-metoxy-1,4-benzoquinol methylase
MPPLRERANKGLHDFVFAQLQARSLLQPDLALLDIGCGTGAWLQRCQSAGLTRLTGLDLDTAQFGLPGIEAHAFNLDHYAGQQWGRFQVITARELIEHLSNPGQLLALAAQNLAPGGTLVISTPNIHSLPARLRFLLRGRLPHFDDKSDPTHVYPVYHENLERVATRYGFHITARISFPEKGYGTFSGATATLSALLKPFLHDPLPGDNLVYLLQREEEK